VRQQAGALPTNYPNFQRIHTMAPRKKTSNRSRKSKSQAQPTDGWTILLRVSWLLAAGFWLLVTIALASYHPADPPTYAFGKVNDPVANWVGTVGAHLAHELLVMLGPGVWLLVAGAAVLLAAKAMARTVNQLSLRAIGVLLLAITSSALIGLGEQTMAGPHDPAAITAGGLIAVFVNDQLRAAFALPGTILIETIAFCIGALVAADQWVLWVPRVIGRSLARVLDLPQHLPRISLAALVPSRARLAALTPSAWRPSNGENRPDDDLSISTRRKDKRHRRRDDDTPIDEDAGGLGATEAFDPNDYDEDGYAYEDGEAYEDDGYEYEYEDEDQGEYEDAAAEAQDETDEDGDDAGDAPEAYMAQRERFDPDELRAKMAKMPINFAPKQKQQTPLQQREPDFSGYQFPGLDLLEEPEGNFTEEMKKIVREQAVELEQALQQYKVQGEVVGIDSGPTITLFEVRLAPGTKVNQISNVDTDLARALKASKIRIVPNMTGKDTVGIEVPNRKKERVRLKELMSAEHDASQKMALPMFLGKDASGNPLVEDLAKMPHMLIAGTTGSGKSVAESSIIMSLLYTRRPDEVKMVLVDPKVVEMSMFKDVPHLMCPVVTEMSKAAAILEWAVTKMDERYELLAEAQVRDIASYNKLEWEDIKERMNPATEAEEARIPKKLPYLVFVIDELADLMMTNKEVEASIVRIAQKARAVGIHLILATQRPQANVVTGLIKSNMPCRVAFKVASGMDSRIVLDQKGGELLLGQGDMLFLSPSSTELMRAQGTLVEDNEIRGTTRYLKKMADQHFEPQLVQIKDGSTAGDGGLAPEERDPLFEDAVQTVLETQRGSVSLLQRRLTVGYGRAARLIEQMADAGIIGEYKGSQAREVQISPDEWEAMKAQAAADAQATDAAGTLYESTHATAADVTETSEIEPSDAAEASTNAQQTADTTEQPAEAPAQDADADAEDEQDEEEDDEEGEYDETDEYEADDAGEEDEADEEEDDGWEYEYYYEEDEYEEEGDEEDDDAGADSTRA
jgi:S-DNA-T family DNA segregation ATPase FtsK/SpoIIIE